MQTFDATVDFETMELEVELGRVITTTPSLYAQVTLCAVVRESAEDTGLGELYSGDEEIPELDEGDWCVSGRTAIELAHRLRACL